MSSNPSLAQGKHLWVEKYSPRSFLELLGDEEINREVLRWLKRWERCVFGESGGHPAGGAKSRSRAKTGKQALDSRPDERILLICGAPGIASGTCRLSGQWLQTDIMQFFSFLNKSTLVQSSSAQLSVRVPHIDCSERGMHFTQFLECSTCISSGSHPLFFRSSPLCLKRCLCTIVGTSMLLCTYHC